MAGFDTKKTGLIPSLLALLLLTACSGSSDIPPPIPNVNDTPLLKFDAMWSDFDTSYTFFILKNIDWQDSRARFRSQLSDSSMDQELFDTLSAMLVALKDGHGDDIDFLLSTMSGIRAMIVDLGNNGGGNDQNGESIAARFTNGRHHYRTMQFRDGPNHDDFGPPIESFIDVSGQQSFHGPIAILTNSRTFSSAEGLVPAFETIPGTLSIGDFTGGGSANPATHTLSNGWRYRVSRWIETRPDWPTFERVGIEPDIRVDISAADTANLRDTIVDTAIQELHSVLASQLMKAPLLAAGIQVHDNIAQA